MRAHSLWVFPQVRGLFAAAVVKARQTLDADGAATEGCWFEFPNG